ncbi:DUF6712 family protein [Riemerella anatipestifer]|uniref:DUF6712 family protein n=3 Tax=Riemerella anatipestifer TaxID=34085 RepID=UPI0007ED103E|nr:hypothetical protein [Riemerella anatipestifer]AZZ59695.1 hypothetical protein AWB57_12090 [Riemerella anatipestifer]MCW0492502.1 hypothetical protein [Riemerella anatipestifer]MCW0511610.1 hypothetical protein [Riemerella anatipestifer]MCW0520109.1 hypothetical protein [Riemerella anatipestifer]MDR7749969.1 hypothetical protein [Riemerella anatipestifer]
MEKIIPDNIIHELVSLPKNFDLDLIDQSAGFESKIFPFISEKQFKKLETEHSAIYKKIAKAGILFSLVMDIPRIKVHLSNYGINQYNDGKSRQAPWWDIRDLGLSWLKKANDNLYSAIIDINEDDNLRADNLFFNNSFKLISIFDFQKFYSLNNSLEVYLWLVGLMNEILDAFLMELGSCNLSDLTADDYFLSLLKKYILNKTINDSLPGNGVVFLSTGMAVQYEELPWQKSMFLGEVVIAAMSKKYLRSSNMYLDMLTNYLLSNKEKFPCYQPIEKTFRSKIIAKDSGLYL